MTTTEDLLPADPARGLTAEQVQQAQEEFDGIDYEFGMGTPEGAARLLAVVEGVAAVLEAGLGRDVALAALHGGLVRLERDGHRECSDTVVRASVCAALELACEEAGVAAFTDEEVGEVALLLAQRAMDASVGAFLSAAQRDR